MIIRTAPGSGVRVTSADRRYDTEQRLPLGVEAMLRLRDRAFEATSSGIVITDAGKPDNPVIDINQAFTRITGYERGEVMGRNCRFLQSEQTDQATVAAIRLGLATAQEVGVTILNRRKDGEPFWNELLISPVRDANGHLTHFVGAQTDITGRKRSEERSHFLAEASNRLAASMDYRTTLDAVARLAVPAICDILAIDLLDEHGHVDRAALSLASYTDHDRQRAVLQRYVPHVNDRHGPALAIRTGRSELVPAVSAALLESFSDAADRQQGLLSLGLLSYLTVPLTARSRRLGALSIATTAASGRRLGADDLLLAEDLARRIALAIDNATLFTETQSALRARDQFLSIAAHELRTPVAGIKGYAQMLMRAQQRGTLTAERLVRSLETINAATDRLTLLTSDLLDVSRIRLGQLPLRPSELDLAATVREIARRFDETSREDVRIVVDIAEGDYRVNADADRIDQVLTNLFENAAKYAPDSHRIDLSMRIDGDNVEIAVHDYGIGLPPDGLEAIFEPFERASNALERGFPGLGLGLYISRGIIERHGGRIVAESDGENTGTTFTVTIPRLGFGPDADGTDTDGIPLASF